MGKPFCKKNLNYYIYLRAKDLAETAMDALKLKLKSATKFKLTREREMCKIRNKERSLIEELVILKSENDFLKEELQEVKTQMVQLKHQISMIEICSTSEKAKIDAHVRNIEHHRKGFQDIFDKERNEQERAIQELHEKEVAKVEALREKEKELVERNEHQARKSVAIEVECDALEQECAVLKKRNNAIMLKLRRKLLETENARRERMKVNTAATITRDENIA